MNQSETNAAPAPETASIATENPRGTTGAGTSSALARGVSERRYEEIQTA